MLRFDELDTSIQTHRRRVADVDRHGWLWSDPFRTGQQVRLGAVLVAVGTRLVPRRLARRGTGRYGDLHAAATGHDARVRA